jgi:sterol desaturase/sphingolipid hydroxylase (fatty acid hydroxylase superfamily)
MERFKYYPPRLTNNIIYFALLGLFLWFLEAKGNQAWAWLMQYMSVDFFVVVIGFSFYLLVFWGVGIPYLLLDKFRKPFGLYKFKIQDIPDERRKKATTNTLTKSILRVLFNQFFGTLPFLVLLMYLLHLRGYDATVAIPSWWMALLQLAGMMLVEDILFFTAHYFMHKKYLFKKFHRIHHEYRESIAIATHHVHYVEHIVGNLIPVFTGAFIFMAHPFVVLFWIMIVVMNALHTHSGYAFPWMAYSVHHDWHHYHVNGSFSAIGLMDQIFGTDKAFNKLKKEHKQLTNKELKN